MVDAIERAVVIPAPQVVVHRAARRQVLRQGSPLTAGAEDVHHPIDHRTHIDRPLVATLLRRRDQRVDERPFLVGQVTRVAQTTTIIPGSIILRPHAAMLP